jgi:hypothetical protein
LAAQRTKWYCSQQYLPVSTGWNQLWAAQRTSWYCIQQYLPVSTAGNQTLAAQLVTGAAVNSTCQFPLLHAKGWQQFASWKGSLFDPPLAQCCFIVHQPSRQPPQLLPACACKPQPVPCKRCLSGCCSQPRQWRRKSTLLRSPLASGRVAFRPSLGPVLFQCPPAQLPAAAAAAGLGLQATAWAFQALLAILPQPAAPANSQQGGSIFNPPLAQRRRLLHNPSRQPSYMPVVWRALAFSRLKGLGAYCQVRLCASCVVCWR